MLQKKWRKKKAGREYMYRVERRVLLQRKEKREIFSSKRVIRVIA